MVFGIDGGGTRARAALVDAHGTVIAQATGGSTNRYSVAPEVALSNLEALLNQVLDQAGSQRKDLTGGCFGSAGLARPSEQEIFADFFAGFLGPEVPVRLCSDGEILLVGGLLNLEGYGLIAGTGSLALGRSADGRLVRAGGLGFMLGDEGSAWWIGHQAIVRSLRSLEDRDLPTTLIPELLKACRLTAPADFVAWVHHDASKADIAAVAPVVAQAAQNQDVLALDILKKASGELALLVTSVVSRSPWIGNKTLVLAGGVLENNTLVETQLRLLLARELPGLTVETPRGSALEGACLLAREA